MRQCLRLVGVTWLLSLAMLGVAHARCGNQVCERGEVVSSCPDDCALPEKSAVEVEVGPGPSIRGGDNRGLLMVASVSPRKGRARLVFGQYDASFHLGKRVEILSRPLDGKGGLGNPHPVVGPDGALYLAFRDHDLSNPDNPVYKLRVIRSRDQGSRWDFLESSVDGLIDTSGHGLWEPFLYVDGENHLRVVYAKERAEKFCAQQRGTKQDLVSRVSLDHGKTWREESLVSGDGISRNGVPAITRLNDGSFLAVFESWQEGQCGNANPNLLIRSMQSADGMHWGKRKVVFDPYKMGRKAIATWPSVGTLPDGRVMVSFTSNFQNLTGRTNEKDERPEAVRNFDTFLLASMITSRQDNLEWDLDSLVPVQLFRSGAKSANRYTSLAVLENGSIVLFSGLPNRFSIYKN